MNFFRRMFGPAPPEEAAAAQPESASTSAPAAGSSLSSAPVGDSSTLTKDTSSIMPDSVTPPEPAAAPEPATEPATPPAPKAAPPEMPRLLDLSDTHPLSPDVFPDAADGATRPLPPEVVLEVTGAGHAVFAQATDMGKVRTNNEDAIYSFYATGRTAEGVPDFGLFVVADGMGGHSEGERASAIAARTVAMHILRESYLPLFSHGERNAPIAEVVTTAIQRANDAVVHDLDDGGTTVSVAVLINDLAYVGHVGDSRVYLISRGKIERITRDHSWVQRLIELDQLTPDEANEHPQKNLLYRALGQSDTLEVDTLMRRMPPSARVVLCSDGLWNQVADADILAAVLQAGSPQDACQRLIAMANAAGGPDNISVIVLQLPG